MENKSPQNIAENSFRSDANEISQVTASVTHQSQPSLTHLVHAVPAVVPTPQPSSTPLAALKHEANAQNNSANYFTPSHYAGANDAISTEISQRRTIIDDATADIEISFTDCETNNGSASNVITENQATYTASEEGFVYDQHSNFVPGWVLRNGVLVSVDNDSLTLADVIRIQSAMAFKIAKIAVSQSDLSNQMTQMQFEMCSLLTQLKEVVGPLQTARRNESTESMDKVVERELIGSIAEFDELEHNLQHSEFKNDMVSRHSVYFQINFDKFK